MTTMLCIRIAESFFLITSLYGVFCTQDGSKGETRIDIDNVEVCSSSNDLDTNITAETHMTVRHCALEISRNQTKVDMRQIRIIGTCESCVLVFNQQSNDSSHCLLNRTIISNEENGSCPQRREYFRGKVDLLLQIGESDQAVYHITFAVYPVFPFMTPSSESEIDVSRSPDGYITKDSTWNGNGTSNSHMRATLSNMPLAGAVTIDIYQLNAILPNFQQLNVFAEGYFFNLKNQNERNIPLRLSGSNKITLLFQTVQGFHLQDDMIHIRYSARSCNTNIRHLNKTSLEKTGLPDEYTSSLYTASCLNGFKLLHKVKMFRCQDEQWDPPLECIEDDAANNSNIPTQVSHEVNTNSLHYGDLTPQDGEQSSNGNDGTTNSEVTSSAPTISTIAITLSLLAVAAILVISYSSSVRLRSREKIPASRILTQPRVKDCKEKADIDPESDYDIIEKTDPYLDYCEIDEYDMIIDLDRKKTAKDKLSDERSDGNSGSDPSFMENLKLPSLDLLGSISREFSKRGINQKNKGCSDLKNKKRTNRGGRRKIPNTPPMPCRGRKAMRIFSQEPNTTEVEVHSDSSAEPNRILQTRHQAQAQPSQEKIPVDHTSTSHHCSTAIIKIDNHDDIRSKREEKATRPGEICDFEDALSVYCVYTLDDDKTL